MIKDMSVLNNMHWLNAADRYPCQVKTQNIKPIGWFPMG